MDTADVRWMGCSGRSPGLPRRSFCEFDVALEHPEVDTIHYAIDVAYPGETAARNRTVILSCSSDGETAACDE